MSKGPGLKRKFDQLEIQNPLMGINKVARLEIPSDSISHRVRTWVDTCPDPATCCSVDDTEVPSWSANLDASVPLENDYCTGLNLVNHTINSENISTSVFQCMGGT